VWDTASVPEVAAIRTSIAGPWGPLHVAATERGVVAVAWLTTDEAFDAELARRLGTPAVEASEVDADDPRRRRLETAIAALKGFLVGRPPAARIEVDLADRPAWDRAVLGEVAAIPWGRTASYGDIARRIGAPRAARAVGGALGRNPVGLLIPCHRVIAADGSIGGYGGGPWGSVEDHLAIKRDLLLREGVTLEPRGG
jgi:methylated-DNA-[protein]-cysteine S-methyltransferase